MNNLQKYLVPALLAAILGVGVIYFATRKPEAVDTNVNMPTSNTNQSNNTNTAPKTPADIRSTFPKPNQAVSSPLEITGEARGSWYFEATFPAQLVDANGKQLAMVPINAQGEWMTNDFVPYKGTITFAKPTTSTGFLILKNSNASGLPESDKELRIPIKFAP